MPDEAFLPSREDGRSDRQVVYDLVGDLEPGDVVGYDQLTEELSAGLDEQVGRKRVYRAVANANRLLLRERQRYLSVVREVGYRILRADEHLPEALDRKHRAVSKLRQGMELLRHAKVDELSEAQRVLHQGQLMIMGGLYDAVRDSHQRHDRQERVIDELRARQRADIEELRRRLDRVESHGDTD